MGEMLDCILGRVRDLAPQQVPKRSRKRVQYTSNWLKHRPLTLYPLRSAFFALLASLMLPPNMPVQLFIFVSVSFPPKKSSLPTLAVGSHNGRLWLMPWLGNLSSWYGSRTSCPRPGRPPTELTAGATKVRRLWLLSSIKC